MIKTNTHWTTHLFAMAETPSQMLAVMELRKLSFAITQDKERWDKFFEEVRNRKAATATTGEKR